MVPFNLRPLDKPVPRELGNKFGLVMLPLPVGTSGSYRRLVEVHRRMQQIKTGRDGPVSYGLLSAIGMTPEPIERRIVDLFSAKGTAVMTNVPGPREPVYLAGTPVRAVLVWAPTSGHIGMSVSIFSYRGEVTVGLMVDATLVPDPEEIVAALERELYALGKLDLAGRRRPATAARLSERHFNQPRKEQGAKSCVNPFWRAVTVLALVAGRWRDRIHPAFEHRLHHDQGRALDGHQSRRVLDRDDGRAIPAGQETCRHVPARHEVEPRHGEVLHAVGRAAGRG